MVLLALALSPGGAAEPPRPEEVSLPVRDYFELIEKGDAAAKERQRRESVREAPIAEVVSQRVRVSLGEEDIAEVTAGYEVLVQGASGGAVVLPVTGVPRNASVRPPGAALARARRRGSGFWSLPPRGGTPSRSRGRSPCPWAGRAASTWPRPWRRSR